MKSSHCGRKANRSHIASRCVSVAALIACCWMGAGCRQTPPEPVVLETPSAADSAETSADDSVDSVNPMAEAMEAFKENLE